MQELDHILRKARDVRDGGDDAWSVQSTGEKLAIALVLNRPDLLVRMRYTFAEAIERVGSEWLSLIPTAARMIDDDKDTS